MNPIIRLRNELAVFSLRRGVRRARIGYFAAGTQAIKTLQALEGHEGRTPSGRARALSALAAHESTMADLITQCRWDSDDDQAHAAEHRDTATLLTLIASTEVAAGAYDRAHGPNSWEKAFGAVLDDLVGAHDPGIRAEAMTRLYIAAHPVIGNDVAETITCLRGSYTRLALATTPDLARPPLTIGETEKEQPLMADQTPSTAPPQGTHHYILTLDQPGYGSVTCDGTVTPPPDATRKDVYLEIRSMVNRQNPRFEKADVIFFSFEPNQI